MVMAIPLGRGLVALVDDADYGRVSAYTWYAFIREGRPTYARARRLKRANGQNGAPRAFERMHRYILGVGAGIQIDHRDRDGLNNVRSNLRVCTTEQNAQNRRAYGETGFKGVYRDRRRFVASIESGGIVRRLGRFDDPIEAAIAYDTAAKQIFGEFAWLNFPNNHPVRPPDKNHTEVFGPCVAQNFCGRPRA